MALVILLVAAHGRNEAWPFIVWPMYARGYPPPPPRVSETELRLVCRDGEVMHLLPARLFTHVEIDLGRRVAAQAFVEQPGVEQYRSVLLRRLGPLLEERDVVEVQGWALSWTVDPMAVPPFDRARPEERPCSAAYPCRTASQLRREHHALSRPKATDGGSCPRAPALVAVLLTTPEPRIAGRRLCSGSIYAAFYIWHLSWVDGAALGLLPDAVWQPVDVLGSCRCGSPAPCRA